jgi:hypothetical protein
MQYPQSILATIILVLLCSAGGIAVAQEEPHIFTLTTFRATMPEGGSVAERDSLLTFVFENVDKKNDKTISERQLVHYYTSDSQEYIILSEYKNWGDIDAANKMDDELMKKAIPDDKKRAEFNRKLGRYFPTHSDRILTERPKFRK